MSAVLLAVFERFSAAESVRTELVRDGFPTDRVELTSRQEEGRAGVQPADSAHQKFLQYYCTLFDRDDERDFARELADRVAGGNAATVAVHPRGELETSRAVQILRKQGAQEIATHDLQSQSLERAASPSNTSIVGKLLPEPHHARESFYTLLFPEAVRGKDPGAER